MNDTLIYVMTAAIVVAAAAILVQTVILFAMFLASRSMRNQITPLIGKMEPVIEGAQAVVEQVRRELGNITGKANEVLELSRKQLVRVDELLGEATARTRVQMDRVEMVLDDTVNRFQETTALLQNGVVRPLRQLAGVTAGLRSAIAVLFGGRRTTVEQATHDEEMFI
jgi:hypothetical protein